MLWSHAINTHTHIILSLSLSLSLSLVLLIHGWTSIHVSLDLYAPSGSKDIIIIIESLLRGRAGPIEKSSAPNIPQPPLVPPIPSHLHPDTLTTTSLPPKDPYTILAASVADIPHPSDVPSPIRTSAKVFFQDSSIKIIMRLRLKHSSGFISIVAVYAPTKTCETEEMMLYAKLTKCVSMKITGIYALYVQYIHHSTQMRCEMCMIKKQKTKETNLTKWQRIVSMFSLQ